MKQGTCFNSLPKEKKFFLWQITFTMRYGLAVGVHNMKQTVKELNQLKQKNSTDPTAHLLMSIYFSSNT